MSKRSVLIPAIVFGVIGTSEAFGKCTGTLFNKVCKCEPDEFGKCEFVKYKRGETIQLEV